MLAFATCSYALNFSRYYSGRLGDAVADARQALDAERYGWREYAIACRAQLAWAHVERGEWDEAEAALAPVAGHPSHESEPAYALEIDHPENREGSKRRLRELAAKYGLAVTGSSDYHGSGKPNRLGAYTTPPEVVERIIAEGTGTSPVFG